MHQFPHLLRGSHPLELASWTSAPGLHHVLGPDVELEVCVCACAVCAEMKVARGPRTHSGRRAGGCKLLRQNTAVAARPSPCERDVRVPRPPTRVRCARGVEQNLRLD